MTRLTPTTTALLVVDVQERLAAAMQPARLESVVRNTGILLDAASQLSA